MMRKYKFFAVFLLVLAFLPLPAYAFDAWPNGSYWTGITTPAHYGAFVRADDIYGAAVYGLNKDPATISVEDRLKLSDPDYGGRFYVYAQTFFNVDGWPEMPEWLPAYVMATTVGLGQSFERVYASEVSTTLRDEALRDLERVLAGEDLSGGGSSSIAQTATLYGSSDFYTNRTPSYFSYMKDNWNGDRNYMSFVWAVNISDAVANVANSHLDEYPYVYLYQRFASTSWKSTSTIDLWLVMSPTPFVNGTMSVTNSGATYIYFKATANQNTYTTYNFTNTTVYNMGGGENWDTFHWFKPLGESSPPPPSGTWPEPETPVTPDPPEQPTPTAPTVTPDTDPTEPVVTWPTSPTVVLPTQPTPDTTPSGLDYTGLLTLINDNLISIDDYVQALNSSFNSFRSDFVTAVDSIVDSIRNIYSYLGHLNDILEVHCKHIRDQIEDSVYNLELYLKGLFEWLPRQLDYDAEFNYDDSYVTMLLQRILNKIPGGTAGTPVTYQPNPQADEPGFFDWLLDLWHRFLIDLVSVLPDELGGLVDAFSQLTHYFPFSIPWDLAALLALFEHEPVTPVFDVPWGFGGDEGEIQMVRVDLHAWDGVMEMVRPVFVVGFCIQLALVTKELLDNFDIHRGGV